MGIGLVGLPGAGKSTVGRQLARRLKLPFVDADHRIEQLLGCSIRSFFEREGESAFRDVEASVIDELTRQSASVIATGGGAVLREANRRCLRERCQVVYLYSAPEDIFRRIQHDTQRPLLQVDDPMARLRELFEARDPLYRQTAHVVVEAGTLSAPAVVKRLLAQLRQGGGQGA
nr:shikimate kinase [Ramlibacter tataouinensis]